MPLGILCVLAFPAQLNLHFQHNCIQNRLNFSPTVLVVFSGTMNLLTRTLLLLPLALDCASAFHLSPVYIAGRSCRASVSDAASIFPLSADHVAHRSSALCATTTSASTLASKPPTYRHTLAILTLPLTSTDRIANDAVLETAMARTSHRVSVVLRGTDSHQQGKGGRPTLSELRSYVGEIYSAAWDCTLGFDRDEDADDGADLLVVGGGDGDNDADSGGGSGGGGGILASKRGGILLDVIVYPQNLPNAAPEGWIALRPDLECICSHDTLIGWSATSGSGTGAARLEIDGQGVGGLVDHVEAVNADRVYRGLHPVAALSVDPWPVGADVQDDAHVVFLEDTMAVNRRRWAKASGGEPVGQKEGLRREEDDEDDDAMMATSQLGGARISAGLLYNSVAVGGTFDGMHYGHRKLLSLAVSSVQPRTGKLLIGVTQDEMLQSKSFRELIPPLEERIRGVQEFVENLAPGMKNRMRVVPIEDAYGPPGSSDKALNDFDALVLSHETLITGKKLNEHRVKNLKMDPLMLLCTRRTEPHGMSSTALRRMKKTSVRTEANMI